MKNKLIKSTIILLIGGAITKILGMIIRITLARKLGSLGLGTYMILMPTFTLFIAISSSFSVAISKLVSEDARNNKKIVFSIIPISLMLNFLLIIAIIFLAPFIATYLLKDSNLKNNIICMGLVLPFISISNILRGYFFGKQKMVPHVISNIIEDLVRLLLIYIFTPLFLLKGLKYAISFVILTNIVSELSSILVLFFFLPKNFKLTKDDFIPDKNDIKDVFKISIPATSSRFIGSIGYFLEPIIITSFLTISGYTNDFIISEYGIISGYVMPLILLPSFFTGAISNALLPIISKSYISKEYNYTKKKIIQAIFYSLTIGIPFTIFIMIKPEFLLNLLYKTSSGINYIRFFAPICILHYIQSPLTSSMQAMGLAKDAMYDTFIGMGLRTLALIILSLTHIGLYSLLIASGINISYVTIRHFYKIKKRLSSSFN